MLFLIMKNAVAHWRNEGIFLTYCEIKNFFLSKSPCIVHDVHACRIQESAKAKNSLKRKKMQLYISLCIVAINPGGDFL